MVNNGINQQIIGSTGNYTYGDVTPDEVNPNKQSLEQTDCVKGPNKINVSLNPSF